MIFGTKTRDRAVWHRWFAWRPVKLMDGRIVWLEEVERREQELGFDITDTYYRLPWASHS